MTKLIFHNQNSLTIKLPMLIDVDDYHEFEHIQKVLSRMSGKTVKVKELTNKYIAEKCDVTLN